LLFELIGDRKGRLHGCGGCGVGCVVGCGEKKRLFVPLLNHCPLLFPFCVILIFKGDYEVGKGIYIIPNKNLPILEIVTRPHNIT
jgi:hypothetical protein